MKGGRDRERERDRQTETERNVHEERMKGGRERELPTYVRIHIKKNRCSVHVHTHTAQTTQTATPNTLLTGTEGGPYQRVYPCKAGPIQGTTTWQSTYLEHIKIIERDGSSLNSDPSLPNQAMVNMLAASLVTSTPLPH